MDRRKRTGVALAAGLLFLFVTEILLLFLAGNSLYKEEQGKLGALVLSHPEQETEYIELFDRGMEAVSLFFSGEQVDTMQFWRNVVKCDCLSC